MAIAHTAPQSYPLLRSEYAALVERGVFDGAHVELLEGRIVSMSPIGGPHRYGVCRLGEILTRALPGRAVVYIQSSFLTPRESQPEPDIAVVPLGDYLDQPPATAYLIVEVAESSLSTDRLVKARLYAAAGVPEYWIVNLVKEVVEVYTAPGPEGYARMAEHGRGVALAVPSFEDVVVRVEDVLPPR